MQLHMAYDPARYDGCNAQDAQRDTARYDGCNAQHAQYDTATYDWSNTQCVLLQDMMGATHMILQDGMRSRQSMILQDMMDGMHSRHTMILQDMMEAMQSTHSMILQDTMFSMHRCFSSPTARLHLQCSCVSAALKSMTSSSSVSCCTRMMSV
jgi:hypothetical protein